MGFFKVDTTSLDYSSYIFGLGVQGLELRLQGLGFTGFLVPAEDAKA